MLCKVMVYFELPSVVSCARDAMVGHICRLLQVTKNAFELDEVYKKYRHNNIFYEYIVSNVLFATVIIN